MRCEGKVGIVTGGAAGIGRAIALALAREGAQVAVWDTDLRGAESVAAQVGAAGVRGMALRVDVSRGQEVRSAVGTVLEGLGRIDILVNNAGICHTTPLEEIDEGEWDRVMAVNLKGVFLCAQAVSGVMKGQRSGVIVNMASVAGRVGGIAVGAHYAASKAGVICLTKSLAKALAPHGVRVNAIAPGPIESDMSRMITGGDWRGYLAGIPMGRIGVAEDVARVAVFLSSDDAGYINGQTIDVNGGQFMN
jgi:3-oxoacyl-[acyl-carrier protein] reductase